jgi:UMF1 family MFS transporter
MDRLSARGFGLGYVGGGLALALVALFIAQHQLFGVASRAEATRLGFLFTGIWWAAFALPALLALGGVRYPRRMSTIPSGLRGYFRILSEVAGYRDLLIFLIAFLFYNDGIQTIIAVSAIFAREVLELTPASILGCFLMVQFVAMPGALAFGRLAERFGAKRAVLASLFLFMGITVFAFRIDSDLEFWILGFAVALVLGGSQATSRSLFAGLVPENRSAEFFGFYTLSGKFASILGPFLFAFMADMTGSTRIAVLALNLFFLAGIVLLALVNVQRGRRAAESRAE